MKITYNISEQDFLDYQLFAASQSETVRRKKKNGWLWLTVACVVLALYFFLKDDMPMTYYFGSVAIVNAAFYPVYFRWRYKRHYQAHVRNNYAARFGQTETLEITGDDLHYKDKTGEGKIYLKEVTRVDETNKHLFLKLSTGFSLIIPKSELTMTDCETLKTKLKESGTAIVQFPNWKW